MKIRRSQPGGLPGYLAALIALIILAGFWAPRLLAQPAAPTVEYQEVSASEIRRWNGFSARISPVESVEVKPLVGGRIDKVLFREGEWVEAGQALFLIDPRPFQAAVKRAEAELATARAQATLSAQELKRSQQLLETKLVSRSVFDNAFTTDQVAQARILEAESNLMTAKLDLEYAHIDAPISGRVGRAELTVGNIVGAGANAPVLTSIVTNDRVYAEFRIDEQTFLSLLREAGKPAEMPVNLKLADDSDRSYQGHLHAFDNHLDAASGTIRARAVFDNDDAVLTPGMFANIELGSAQKQWVLLVPERAIGTNQSRKFVYVIGDDNVVRYQEVSLGRQFRNQRVIEAGLSGGERIAINGLSHIRPNAVVNPQLAVSHEPVDSSVATN